MSTQLETPPEQQSTTSLVGGILDDVQDLFKQQVQLTRKEIVQGAHNVSEAVQFFAAGGATLALGLFFVILALVHLLHWATSPAGSDPAYIPLWGCYALVGGPLALLGAIFTWFGREKLRSIDPLHNPATEALKENVKWATNSK